jgi:hypothetical protein
MFVGPCWPVARYWLAEDRSPPVATPVSTLKLRLPASAQVAARVSAVRSDDSPRDRATAPHGMVPPVPCDVCTVATRRASGSRKEAA